MSVQLWRGRLKRESIQQLSRLGLCVSYESTLKAIDRVRTEFDTAVRCNVDLESALANNAVPEDHDTDEDLPDALSMSINIDAETNDDYLEEGEETVLYSDVTGVYLF